MKKLVFLFNIVILSLAANTYNNERDYLSNININNRNNQKSNDNNHVSKIYYPANATNKQGASHNRLPLEDNVRCRPGENLYPADNPGDWACDCKPGFIFYPHHDACYEAYRRGPCHDGEILVIIRNLPKCIPNVCKRDGLVEFNGNCQQLDSNVPCRHFQYLIGRITYLTINPNTHELTCADIDHMYECIGLCCEKFNGIKECFQRRYNRG